MSGKLLGLMAAAALLASLGAANAKDPVKLTDGQLDKVTAGNSFQIPVTANFPAGAGFNNVLAVPGNLSSGVITSPVTIATPVICTLCF